MKYLDVNNILWKVSSNGELVGKRAVQTKDLKSCWLEDTTPENVKYWLHGTDSSIYDKVVYNTSLGIAKLLFNSVK